MPAIAHQQPQLLISSIAKSHQQAANVAAVSNLLVQRFLFPAISGILVPLASFQLQELRPGVRLHKHLQKPSPKLAFQPHKKVQATQKCRMCETFQYNYTSDSCSTTVSKPCPSYEDMHPSTQEVINWKVTANKLRMSGWLVVGHIGQ